MELDRLDYTLMKILKKKECNSAFESITIREIMEITETSRPTTYRKMMHLCDLEYVSRGCKSAQADTFYLLPKGISMVENRGGLLND